MINLIENELKKQENYSTTENGAIGYKSSNSALIDLNYQVSSLRKSTEEEIASLFEKAYLENKEYAVKWLFFARDIREGLGERRLFRICYKKLANLNMELFYANLENISEYGRWDDLVSLIGISKITDITIGGIIEDQLKEDLDNLKENKPISLLGKWLPSENASSKKTKALGRKIRKLLGLSSRQYRLILSKLREQLRVVEVQMCDKKWNEIDYESVPSMANLKYRNAFLRNDEERRRDYLKSVGSGDKRINMEVATPIDVVSRYTNMWGYPKEDVDSTLELAWKNLKDVFVKDTLVVADGSGSMTSCVSGRITALDVANALAIYTSEHNSGVYKNKYITFSNKPNFVDFNEESSLKDKLKRARKYNEIGNTNIEAVFDLILGVAVENNVSSEDMISNVLIISDMEFDAAQRRCWNRSEDNPLTRPLFEEIKKKYEDLGYNLPKLVFWNVNSRTKTIPLIENDLGVVLVSGFSQNVLNMVMSGKYNPYEVLVEVLDGERYSRVFV